MSLQSFSLISMSDEMIVDIMAKNLYQASMQEYRYEFAIAKIELTFREANRETAYHELNMLPFKSTRWDPEKESFIDTGKILIRTDKFDFTLYKNSRQTVNLKKHSTKSIVGLPFEESDAQAICLGLTAHHIKIPDNLEIDLIRLIAKGMREPIVETLGYEEEEKAFASAAGKVASTFMGLFKTK